MMFCSSIIVFAQRDIHPLPNNLQRVQVINGEQIVVVRLPEVTIFPRLQFKNEKESAAYWQMVGDVKKTLPLAKLAYRALIETYEYIQYLPDDKARKKHLKKMEDELWEEYKPVLKTLNIRQGKVLLKLINRECNQSSYQIVKAFLGGFSANFWNSIAFFLGASMNTQWDPQGKDVIMEQICVQIEQGTL